MSDPELEAIGRRIRTLPVFRDFDPERLVPVSQECSQILQDDDGLNAVLGLVAVALPAHLRETAYALALEVALTDAQVLLEEMRVLDMIRHALGLDGWSPPRWSAAPGPAIRSRDAAGFRFPRGAAALCDLCRGTCRLLARSPWPERRRNFRAGGAGRPICF